VDAYRLRTLPLGERTAPTSETSRRLPGPLYDRPGILVTDEWFVVAGYRYSVMELSNLRTGRGPRHPLTVRAMVVAVVVLLGLAAVLGLTADPTNLPPGTYVAIAAALIAPFVLAAFGERLRPRPYELWADYYGITVRIFFSDSEQQYGQVTRALIRAKEIARLGGAAELRELEPWRTWRRMAMRR
jgi:uncharacterized protein DUF6232